MCHLHTFWFFKNQIVDCQIFLLPAFVKKTGNLTCHFLRFYNRSHPCGGLTVLLIQYSISETQKFKEHKKCFSGFLALVKISFNNSFTVCKYTALVPLLFSSTSMNCYFPRGSSNIYHVCQDETILPKFLWHLGKFCLGRVSCVMN